MAIGQKFDKVYYFATVPVPSLISLKMKNTIISYIKDGCWIGVVELILYINNIYNDKNLVELTVGRNNREVIYFEWDAMVRLY